MLIGPRTVTEIEAERIDVQKAAQAFGQQLVVADATSGGEIEAAFAKFVERGIGALLVGNGSFTNSHREAQSASGRFWHDRTGANQRHFRTPVEAEMRA